MRTIIMALTVCAAQVVVPMAFAGGVGCLSRGMSEEIASLISEGKTEEAQKVAAVTAKILERRLAAAKAEARRTGQPATVDGMPYARVFRVYGAVQAFSMSEVNVAAKLLPPIEKAIDDLLNPLEAGDTQRRKGTH